jgi:hypothetical protein
MVEPLRHRQTKEAATAMFNLQPPRHISTLHEAGVPPSSRLRPLSNEHRTHHRGIVYLNSLARVGPWRTLNTDMTPIGGCLRQRRRPSRYSGRTNPRKTTWPGQLRHLSRSALAWRLTATCRPSFDSRHSFASVLKGPLTAIVLGSAAGWGELLLPGFLPPGMDRARRRHVTA